MILCGWCGVETASGAACVNCRRDPALPYIQRNQIPEVIDPKADQARLLARLRRENPDATGEQIAELLGVSPRTVRRMSALRPSTPTDLT